MCLLRANYDALVRRRLIYETELENEANRMLAEAPRSRFPGGDEERLGGAQSDRTRTRAALACTRGSKRCARILFDSIGLQTSVAKYQASGAERGAFLDFIDYPLNNRWWLEDRFAEIAALPSEAERLQQLDVLRTWEHPGPGSFYDDLGNIAKSPHVIRWDPATTNPAQVVYAPRPTYWWLDEGQSRARLSWLTTMESNATVVYDGLDPDSRLRDSRLRVRTVAAARGRSAPDAEHRSTRIR